MNKRSLTFFADDELKFLLKQIKAFLFALFNKQVFRTSILTDLSWFIYCLINKSKYECSQIISFNSMTLHFVERIINSETNESVSNSIHSSHFRIFLNK